MSFSIEKATSVDLEEILYLFKNTIEKSCAKDYNEAQILAWTSSINDKERWKTKIKNQYFIVVKLQHKIVGFGSLENNYIDFLFVHHNFLRQGIASLIYETLKNEADKLEFTSLLTHASKTAVPFFESKGFKIFKENKIIRKGVEITNFEMTQNRKK
ncbi:GNAT family N-acetyltransferase [uncultured Polaribacter sp.]|uniref:GNAT family N-acetyltransferase n=1 Tax=uncultured Polaribacter sp. TaxID=174711 RepID=UPI00260F4119|nr:GNAT family N-acetyltransferase [uncultured Polaribacter sp.]